MSIVFERFAGHARRYGSAAFRHAAYPPTLLLGAIVASLTVAVLAFGRLPGDVFATKGFQSLDAAWLRQLMLFGDTAGSKPLLFGLLGLALLVLLPLRRWKEASVLGLAALFYVFSPLLK